MQQFTGNLIIMKEISSKLIASSLKAINKFIFIVAIINNMPDSPFLPCNGLQQHDLPPASTSYQRPSKNI